eukprot:m.6340 g.6340  ORF g.6340 m.6340 type:complete len:448 (+) comp2581_c0_seq1:33-1376(+)
MNACCLRLCGKPITEGDARVDISSNTKKMKREIIKNQSKVVWKINGICGDASFHTQCYDKLTRYLNGSGYKDDDDDDDDDEDDNEVKDEVKDEDEREEKIGQSSHKMMTRGKRNLSSKASTNGTRKKTKTPVYFSDAERDALYMAMETAEIFDSQDKIKNCAEEVAKLLKQASHACIFSGAGLSTSAGIGDYRGKKGKWTEEDTGIQQDDVGVPYEALRPTYSHEAISKLMDMGLIKYVISQNCDGLHVLSGIPLEKISELHGNIYLEYCNQCGEKFTRNFYTLDDSEETEAMLEAKKVKKGSHVEICETCENNHFTGRNCEKKECKGKLRDTIINFGDLLNEDVLQVATENSKKCDLMISIGSTMTVTPASTLAVPSRRKDHLVIVNRQRTDIDDRAFRRGQRVFGDIDPFFRILMRNILSKEGLAKWEKEIVEKKHEYDKQRASM